MREKEYNGELKRRIHKLLGKSTKVPLKELEEIVDECFAEFPDGVCVTRLDLSHEQMRMLNEKTKPIRDWLQKWAGDKP